MIHKLEFLNNVHGSHRINVTVRNGLKWSRQVRKFDIVNIAETGKAPTAQARIEGVITCRFADIPEFILVWENDESCRSYCGLADCMAATYPGFTPNDTVTVLFYRIIDVKGQN